MTLQAKLDKAFSRLQRGEINDAIRIYTDILGNSKQQPDALYMLGAIAYKLGAMEQSFEFATAATEASPRYARGWVLKALSLRALRRVDEALTTARYALELDPQLTEAWECAGMALMHYGKWAEARSHFELALEYVPENAALHGCYALVLAEQGDLISGWNECREALLRNPDTPVALMAKTTILAHAGYYDLALACCRAAGKHEKIRKSMAFGEAETLLITGRFEKGYAMLAADEPTHSPKKSLSDWRGQDDPNLHLVLFGEQGYGDTLQFIRFVERASEKVGRVTVRVPIPLERLIRTSMPELPISVYQPLTTVGRRPMREIDPVFEFPPDAQARSALTSLPYLLDIGANPQPETVPYLHAEPVLMAQWRSRIAKVARPRIGLVWSGSEQNSVNHMRSIPFEELSPLIERFGPHLVSMQTASAGDDARAAGIFDATPFIKDFADSAALLQELDLLVTVCSAPAHLAGGMGRPVWLALAYNADWRWLVAREDSPWYPSARLYRQPQPGDWGNVVRRICEDLDKFMSGDRDILKPPRWKGGYPLRNPNAVELPGIQDEAGFSNKTASC